MKDRNDYDEATTKICERALLTLIGDIGPWSDRIYLAGGLAPRYLVGALPSSADQHIGTTDVDLVIALAIEDSPEAYETLQANLKKSGFTQTNLSYQWEREVDGTGVLIEFLCETDQVAYGKIHRPREGTGSKVGAFNVRGAQLAATDYEVHVLEGERLDNAGLSKVDLRVSGILTFTVLKILAFQDRHENKDAYDLVFTLLHHPEGPSGAGRVSGASDIATEPLVHEALDLLEQRFESVEHDGPIAYSSFLADPDDIDSAERLRNEAVFTVRQFVDTFRAIR